MGKKTATASATKKTEKKTEKKEEKKTEKKVTATTTPATPVPATPSTPSNTPASSTEKSEKSKKLAVKKTVGKKVRDPDAPKRGISPYFHFSAKRRPELKAAHPETSFGDLTKMVAAEWNTMQDADKAPFNKLAADDKARYEAEKAAYEAKSKQ